MALAFSESAASACDNSVGVVQLGSAGIDRIVFAGKAPFAKVELNDAASISEIVRYMMDLGGAWRWPVGSAAAPAGELNFYSQGRLMDVIVDTSSSLQRGACVRPLKSSEYSRLLTLLDLKEATQ